MTVVDVVPRGHRALRWAGAALLALVLLVGGAIVLATYYYDSVPLTEPSVPDPAVRVADLPPPVANAFVAAVDPDFYEPAGGRPLSPSLLARRYTMLASGAGTDAESSWRIRVMADKAESAYTRTEILGRYLNSADYGRGAVGLDAAAQRYFHKPAKRLTVAEAALLAVQLDPDRPTDEAGWEQVLHTMVERGWLSAAERNKLAFPG